MMYVALAQRAAFLTAAMMVLVCMHTTVTTIMILEWNALLVSSYFKSVKIEVFNHLSHLLAPLMWLKNESRM